MIPPVEIDGYVVEGWNVNEDDWYDFDEDGNEKGDGECEDEDDE